MVEDGFLAWLKGTSATKEMKAGLEFRRRRMVSEVASMTDILNSNFSVFEVFLTMLDATPKFQSPDMTRDTQVCISSNYCSNLTIYTYPQSMVPVHTLIAELPN